METLHRFYYSDARDMGVVPDSSVELVVTSPPYPMISMWDQAFRSMNPEIAACLDEQDGLGAYSLMHAELSKVWREVFRTLVPGGIACINIGDATRTIKKHFRLYPNHATVLSYCSSVGFDVLPGIIWRKPTNSPTKFMGSGMLPPSAYVTLEHERILVFRKPYIGTLRAANGSSRRQRSAYFWEERNKWFNDFWELNGARQGLNAAEIRKRSGAFPLEVPLRLVQMFSAECDTVLDPFVGTGTTTLACLVTGRNSIAFEINPAFSNFHREEITSSRFLEAAKVIPRSRLDDHLRYVDSVSGGYRNIKYRNAYYGFPVITRQEIGIIISSLSDVVQARESEYVAHHGEIPGSL